MSSNPGTSGSRRKNGGAASPPPDGVSPRVVGNLTQLFKLLADESRLRIVLALAEHGELHVSALRDMLEQTQPAVSHHLTLLRATGMVDFRRAGKHNYYRLQARTMRDVLDEAFSALGNHKKAIECEEFTLIFKARRRGR